jgi:hypothetical protein
VSLRDRLFETDLRDRVASTPVRPIETVSTGQIAVEGEVRPRTATVGPTRSDDLVFVAVTETRERETTDRGVGYQVVDRTVRTVPFAVTDGSDALTVDPRDAGDVFLRVSAANTQVFYGPDQLENRMVRRLVGGSTTYVTGVDPQDLPETVTVERTLRPGDDIYVLAKVVNGPDDPTVGGEDLVLSDVSRSVLLDTLSGANPERAAVPFLVVGVAAVAILAFVVAFLFVVLA